MNCEGNIEGVVTTYLFVSRPNLMVTILFGFVVNVASVDYNGLVF